jgi:exopolysaccharide biosynthesis polyprenyl glycosylphosphotransferase
LTKRVLILGTGSLALSIVREIACRPRNRYSVIGVVSEREYSDSWQDERPLLGSLRDVQTIIAVHKPNSIVLAMEEQGGQLPADQLVEAQLKHNIPVESGWDVYERLTGTLAIESLTFSNVIVSPQFRPPRFAKYFARITSFVVAVVGVVLCLPLFALLAALIKFDSPGPVLFVQERAGLNGRRFKLLKFRSMRVTPEAHSEWAYDNRERITRTGRWLRKFRLDELPQLVNVILGEMNIVGPRPHPASNRDLFVLVSRNIPNCGEQIPYYSLRSSVRPGITGWAQVRYKYANGLDEEMEKLRYDLYYVKHYSPLLDLRILLETVKVVLVGRGSGDESAGEAQVPASRQALGVGGYGESNTRLPQITRVRPAIGTQSAQGLHTWLPATRRRAPASSGKVSST